MASAPVPMMVSTRMTRDQPTLVLEGARDEITYWLSLKCTRSLKHLPPSVAVSLPLLIDLVVKNPVGVFYPLSEEVELLKAFLSP